MVRIVLLLLVSSLLVPGCSFAVAASGELHPEPYAANPSSVES